MIFFEDWSLRTDGQAIAQQFDNLTRTLVVQGEVPDDWEWTMLVQVGDAMDILPLTFMKEGLGVVLTAGQLSISGYYKMQLRATRGELVRHTNTINVYIPASLSGDKQWPDVPSEFTDLERRATEAVHKAEKAAVEAGNGAGQAAAAEKNAEEAKVAAQNAAAVAGQSAADASASEQAAAEYRTRAEQGAILAESYTSHPPIVGENGNWWGWDGTQYMDSGKPSQGELTVRWGNTLYSDALKGTARGAAVRVDDVGPLEHGVPVRVSSKNLCPTASVTAIGNSAHRIHLTTAKYPNLHHGTYTLSADVTVYEDDQASIRFFDIVIVYTDETTSTGRIFFTTITDDISEFRDGLTRHYSVTVQTDPSKMIRQITLAPLGNASDSEYRNAKAENIQLECGATATGYTPYVPDLSAVTVYQHGKNLCHKASITSEEDWRGRVFLTKAQCPYLMASGIKYTLSADVTVYPDDVATTRFFDLEVHYTVGNVTLGRIMFSDASTIQDGVTRHYCVSVQVDPDREVSRIVLATLGRNGSSSDFSHAKAENIQFEIGGTETAYEPYTAPVTYTVAEDNTCEATSIAPTMTLTADNPNVVLECEYNRDINKAYDRLVQAIISMGGNV